MSCNSVQSKCTVQCDYMVAKRQDACEQSKAFRRKTNLGHVLSLALALVSLSFLCQVARLKDGHVKDGASAHAGCFYLQSLAVLSGANLGGLWVGVRQGCRSVIE